MFSDELQNPVPIDFSLGAVNDVSDVCSIKTLAPCDEEFRSQKFFRRKNPRRNTKNNRGLRALHPRLIYYDYRVAHARDEVDKVFSAMRFCQPYGIAGFASEAVLLKNFQR